MLLTVAFIVLMLAVFGSLLRVAVKMTWGVVRILLGLVLLPAGLIALAVAGFVGLALILVLVVGAVAAVIAIL